MSEKFITIQEASDLANKSVQTLRRAIKAKKIKVRRKKTPQGFNYLVDLDSVIKAFKLEKAMLLNEVKTTEKIVTKMPVAKTNDSLEVVEKQYSEMKEVFGEFNSTVQKLMEQNNKDRENYFRLMQGFQDRVVLLENQLKLLEAATNKKKWFSFWS